MTDKEKVANGINCCTSRHDCSDCEYFRTDDIDGNCIDHLLKDALELINAYETERLEWIGAVARLTAENELLKKQEAVVPQKAPFPDASRSDGSWYFICGACGKPIDPNDKFCRWCGKAVKWE